MSQALAAAVSYLLFGAVVVAAGVVAAAIIREEHRKGRERVSKAVARSAHYRRVQEMQRRG